MKNASLTTFTIALLLTLLFAASDSIRAQESNRPRSSFTINTDLVVTWAQILNPKDGSPVKGLGIDDFLLREEGKPQQISIAKEDQPISAVILVEGAVPCDTDTLPVAWSFARSREALHQLGEDAEIALMVWYSDVVLVQPMTKYRNVNVIADRLEDRNSLINASHNVLTRIGDSGDYDLPRPGEAIYQAARYLEGNASPGRRNIIIIIAGTSWINKTHYHSAVEVKGLLEKTGTTVYGLYQDTGFSPARNLKDRKRRSGGTIEEFAEQTGGSILTGKPEEGGKLLIKLTGLIRSSYTIGYYPENSDFDGRFRRISLELSPRGRTKVGEVYIKMRSGYQALRPSPPAVTEMPPQR